MTGLGPEDVDSLWVKFDREESVSKIGNLAVVRLGELYRSLDDDDRRVFEDVVISWVGSSNPRRDFAGVALINEQAIAAGLPVLKSALKALETASGPSVPFDRAALERIISKLEPVE